MFDFFWEINIFIFDDRPFIRNSSCWNWDELIAEGIAFDQHSSIPIFLLTSYRPFRSRFYEFLSYQSPSCTLHNVYWCLRVHIVSMICSCFDWFTFVGWPSPFVIMEMTHLDHINPIFVHQFFKLEAKICYVMKLVLIWRIESSVNTNNNPLNTWIISCIFQVIFKKIVLIWA